MRACGENLVSKRDPKIARNSRISWENQDFPSPKLRFSSLKIRFSSTAFRFPRNPRKSSSTAFRFLRRISTFRNGFLIFLNGFPFLRNLLQRLSDFFNGFPLSSKLSRYSYREYFIFPLRTSSYFPLEIAIFRDKIIGGRNTKDRQLEYE